jgi:hypothetical protein
MLIFLYHRRIQQKRVSITNLMEKYFGRRHKKKDLMFGKIKKIISYKKILVPIVFFVKNKFFGGLLNLFSHLCNFAKLAEASLTNLISKTTGFFPTNF